MPNEYDRRAARRVDFGTVPMPKQSNVPEELTSLAAETVSGAETAIEQAQGAGVLPRRGRLLQPRPRGRGPLARGPHRRAHLDADRRRPDDRRRRAVRRGDGAARARGRHPRPRRDGVLPRRGAGGRGRLRRPPATTCTPGSRSTSRASDGCPSTPPRRRTRSPTTRTRSRGSTRSRRCCSRRPRRRSRSTCRRRCPMTASRRTRTSTSPGSSVRSSLIGGISLAILALLASPFIVIGAWKAAKRRARRSAARTADRISGGWDELTDRAVDYGAQVGAGRHPRRGGRGRREQPRRAAGRRIAERADARSSVPATRRPKRSTRSGSEVDGIVGGLGKDAGFWKRTKARLSLRSLLGGTAISTGLQNLKDAATARVRREPGTIKEQHRARRPPHPRARPHDTATVRHRSRRSPGARGVPDRRADRRRPRNRPRWWPARRRLARGRARGGAATLADRRSDRLAGAARPGSSSTR